MTSPSPFLEQVNAVVVDNINNECFCQKDLSSALCLSSSQVYRKIKQQAGVTPSVYIRNKRLEKAFVLLTSTELLIYEITFLVGFGSLSYFSRCFSEYYGYPPSSLRYP